MTNFKARPTTYKGIEMRSRLEAGFAAWLDEVGYEWEYEPECFAGKDGQYLPDFLLHRVPMIGGDSTYAYLEVKPGPPQRQQRASTLEKQLSIVWESKPDALIFNAWPEQGVGDTGLARLYPLVPEHVPEYGSAGVLISNRWSRTTSNDGPKIGMSADATRPARPWPDGYWKVGDGS